MATGTNKKVSTLMVIIAFGIVYLVWGSTYLFIQVAVQSFPPFLLGALRFLIAGLLLMLWSAIRGEKLFIINDIKHAFIGGFLMLFIGTGAVIWVEQYLPSAMVAIVVSSAPSWFLILDKPKWKENFHNRGTITGLIIGFAGIVLLFGEKLAKAFSTNGEQAELIGMGIILIGAIAWAGG
ncbi:MAG: EamA family transporter, partial [Chitinophagaceae bacterium]